MNCKALTHRCRSIRIISSIASVVFIAARITAAADLPGRNESGANPQADVKRTGFEGLTAMNLNNRGETSRMKGDFDAAIKDFTEAIRLDPKFGWPYNNRGLTWERKGDLAAAIKDFTEAMRLDPNDPFPANNRGDALRMMREYDKAMPDFAMAIRLNPNYAYPYNNRGLTWIAKGEFDKAIDDCTQAIRIDSNYSYPYFNRGTAWESKGEFGKAIADYAEAIRVDSSYAHPYNSIAWIRATCHDDQYRSAGEAIRYATQACELTGWKSHAELDTLAAAYAESGDFTSAIIWELTAIEKAPAADKESTTDRLALYRLSQPYHQSPKRENDRNVIHRKVIRDFHRSE